ncbi:MAG: bifunctional uroporphyrinogen-III C-methyltransferase/uroporphyrinogen-III synthase, partial [Thermodesulfovibrionales bacterium]|nr:bifunctional uroporphyrinogen-III C-methyltransferase/uroporphyrinogen-III synthase [Thermodesulfovibrionales bacterium]
AVIRWGTRPDQKTITGTLRDIAGIMKEKDIKPPAVMIVGEVVKLRKRLMWYEKKPMFWHRVLVTREHAGGFEPLEDLGAEIIEFPTIEIAPPENYRELDSAINKVEAYDWIIFTSGNGVKYFFRRLLERDKDVRDLKGIKICAIGTKTAAEIKRYGIKVNLVPEEFNAEGLIEAFIKRSAVSGEQLAEHQTPNTKHQAPNTEQLKGMKFLLPRAEKAREIFPEKVRESGGEIDVPVTYRAVKPDMHGKRLKRFLKEGRISVATFTSASTFDNFIEIMGADADELLKDVAIAVIGPVTARAVEKAGLKVEIMSETATIEAMVEEIIKWAIKRQAAV